MVKVVCFSIFGEMSVSGNIMRMAAENPGAMNLVRIVDSTNLSTGIGHLVIEAAIMARGVLRLHPKILVEDGKMRPRKKYRVFITHSGCDRELPYLAESF